MFAGCNQIVPANVIAAKGWSQPEGLSLRLLLRWRAKRLFFLQVYMGFIMWFHEV